MKENATTGNSGKLKEYELLVDAVEDYAIFLLSVEGRIDSWNPGAERIFGYTAQEAVGKHFSMFYPPEEAVHKTTEELSVATAFGRVEDEGWRIRNGGQKFWANTVLSAVHSPDGSLRGFAKVTRDLTERRNREEDLRRSAEALQLLISSVREYAIFMLDPDGNVVSWNLGAERIKGYKAEEIIGKHFSTFYTPEDRANGKPQRILETARVTGKATDQAARVRKDGTRFIADVVITAVHDQQGHLRGFAKVTRDVTAEREAEETRKALLEQREARLEAEENRRKAENSFRSAQEANRAKDQFLMMLSHELRTPMTAIIGWTKLLESVEQGDPLFEEAIGSIGRAARHQASLVDDVLDLSKIASGKLRLDIGLVEIGDIVKSVVTTVRPSADAKQLQLLIDVSDDVGPVAGDAVRIQQVIWNLLANAVKFTPPGGMVVLQARRNDAGVQIMVRDTGQGIEASFIPHVFEAFRQAENASTRTTGGLGLGLSIVRYIVEAHGGTIVAESEGKGKGATFTLTLPAPAVSALKTSSSKGAALRDRKTLADVSILLVEDDPETRRLVTVLLQRAGAKVTASASAADARKALEIAIPSLVITDISMPHEDGFQVLRDVRQRVTTIPVVALTALGPLQRDEAMKAGFSEYLTKPVEPFTLVDAIARVLRTFTEQNDSGSASSTT